MKSYMHTFIRLLVFSVLLLTSRAASAHFPWLVVEGGKANYFFGEDPSNRTYRLPPTIAKAEIMMRSGADKSVVETKLIESEKFIGKQSVNSIPDKADLMRTRHELCTLGSMRTRHELRMLGSTPTRRRPST